MSSAEEQIAALTKKVEKLAYESGKTQDFLDVQRLHYIYGYYLDKCLYEQVVDLFSDDGVIAFHGGTYEGRKGIERLYLGRFRNFTAGKNGPITGFLLDHVMLQPILTISDDRLSCKGRLRTLMSAGRHKDFPMYSPNNPKLPHAIAPDATPRQWWEGGIYENVYSRKSLDSPWQIQLLFYHPLWHADFKDGWSNMHPNYVPFPTKTFPEDPAGPDKIHSEADTWLWSDTHTLQFHWAYSSLCIRRILSD